MSDVEEDAYLEASLDSEAGDTDSDEISCSEEDSESNEEDDNKEDDGEDDLFVYDTGVGIRLRAPSLNRKQDKEKENTAPDDHVNCKKKRIKPEYCIFAKWSSKDVTPEAVELAKEKAAEGSSWGSVRHYKTGDTSVTTAICKARYRLGCQYVNHLA